jgi:hypothetical protein
MLIWILKHFSTRASRQNPTRCSAELSTGYHRVQNARSKQSIINQQPEDVVNWCTRTFSSTSRIPFLFVGSAAKSLSARAVHMFRMRALTAKKSAACNQNCLPLGKDEFLATWTAVEEKGRTSHIVATSSKQRMNFSKMIFPQHGKQLWSMDEL